MMLQAYRVYIEEILHKYYENITETLRKNIEMLHNDMKRDIIFT